MDEIGEVDDKVVALEWEIEQERLHAEARMKQLMKLKAKKVNKAAEKAEREIRA
jgi:hypothetical protein